MRNVASLSIPLAFEPLYVYIFPNLVYFGSRTPENGRYINAPSLKTGTTKMCQMVNKSVLDCSLSLTIREQFKHVTLDILQTFKVMGLKVKVTAQMTAKVC